MSDEVVNLPVSVLHRLRNKARAEGRNPQELLRYYAIERFLYRLAQSVYAEKFVLKGALIFLAWGLDLARPTRDIDLAGFAPVNVETISRVMKDVCRTAVIADGMAYDAESVLGVIIREGMRYLGVRISIDCALGKTRLPIHIDIGAGDAITPGVVHVRSRRSRPPFTDARLVCRRNCRQPLLMILHLTSSRCGVHLSRATCQFSMRHQTSTL